MVEPRSLLFEMPDGVSITADAYGNPAHPPVLLSHGGGQTRHAWGGTAQALAESGWYCITYDHRGHGDSGWSPDGDYGLDRFAQDQLEIAGQLSQAPVVVGASLGGLSAMLAQGEYNSDAFAAIVLVDITPNMSVDGAMNVLKFMSTHLDEGFATLDEAADAIAEYTGRPRRQNLEGLQKNLRLRDGRYYWHWDPEFMRLRRQTPQAPARMVGVTQKITSPILLVRGRLSDLVTEEIAQEFLQLVPHAQYVDVEHARHMVAGDRNDIFTRAVVDFLTDLMAA